MTLTLVNIAKICRENLTLVKVGKRYQALYRKT